MALARREHITEEEWTGLIKYDTAAEVQSSLKQSYPSLTLEDAFRYRKDSHQVQILLRVRKTEVDSWLKGEKLPIMCTPLGEDAKMYRVIWANTLHL